MKNSRRVKPLFIILLLILLILGLALGGVYVYLMTDLFKTPEQLFKKYMISNVIQLTQTNFEPFNEISERSEEEVTQYLLDLGIDIPGILSSESEKIDVDLKLTTDIPNRNEELELVIDKNEKEFFKGSLALTDETFGIKVPDLYDKYVAVENRDFKKMAKTFNLSEEYINMIPDKIPSEMSEEDRLKIEALASKYVTKIVEQFGENTYIAEKDIKININSKDIETDRYTLAIESKSLYTVVTTAVKELLDDPEFAALYKDRISDETIENLKTSYNEFLTENPVEDIEDKTLKVSVYAADGRTVKTGISVDENEAYVALENNETESTIIFYSTEPKSETNDVGTTTTTILKNTFANNSGELSYEITTEYNKDDIETLQKEYDSKFADFTTSYSTDYSELYKDSTQKYIIKTTKNNESTITGTVELEGEDLDAIKEMVDIKFKCQFGNATVNTINETNADVINDFTMEEYQKLLVDIGTNVASTALTKPDSLIGGFLSKMMNGDSSSDLDYSYSTDDEELYSNTDESSDTTYEDLTLPDDADNDNYLNPTISTDTEIIKNEIDLSVTNALNTCLDNYKSMLEFNPEEDLGIHLNVENVQQYCGDRYVMELIDSTTIKCAVNENGEEHIYYALMNIDGYELVVTEVEVLTEEEYLNR